LEQSWLGFKDLLGSAGTVDWINAAKIALELVIIGYAVIWMWGRIKGTQAERLVKGISVIFAVFFFSWILGLTLITTVLQHLLPVAFVSFVIIFQPEIRRGLGYLGRTTWRVDLSITDTQKQKAKEVIHQIINAVRELSRNKTGALIVIEPAEGERDYLSPGTTINGEVSGHLLISIFESKSPLHDGAVVIRADKIVAAGVILPITDNPKLSLKYGTRHRAAIGLSEIYDGLCVVVSEETGSISAANRGMLVKYRSAEDLADPLSYFYNEGTSEAKPAVTPFQAFLGLFSGSRNSTALGGTHTQLPPSFQPDTLDPSASGTITAPSLAREAASESPESTAGKTTPSQDTANDVDSPAVLEDVRHPTSGADPTLR
jgi:diadenylate cyclase